MLKKQPKFVVRLLSLVIAASLVSQTVWAQTKSEQVKESASQAAGSLATMGIMIAVTNSAIGESLMSKCGPHASWACMMGAMAIAQVGVTALTAKGSGKTGKDLGGGSGTWDDGMTDTDFSVTPPPGTTPGNNDIWGQYGSEAGFKKAVDETIKGLDKKGYKVDTKAGTVTDPSGKKHSLAGLGSSKALLDAGLIKPEDVANVDEVFKKLNDRPRVVAVALAGGGGGGGGSARSVKFEYEDPYEKYKSLSGEREKPGAVRREGLTRTLASGENIGAQTDNIFMMIHRRYQQKKLDFEFIDEN